ncbi:MAG: 3-dehydroquinate dehydratase [Phyllobacteriaceae bacterium]|nr:3-dehydroquinate dehydratase [Phyllobacteriaceae bacterium]MBA91461.1 3-dehydroquinate dehydratase [Phyllobacteriaceae bacterium]
MSGAIHILNGPNLNRLGTREPEIYGAVTLTEIEGWCRTATERDVVFRQSNYEGDIVTWVHEAIDAGAAGLIINPAGLSFSSVPAYDALKMFPGPVIELHISNIHRREEVYHRSLVSKVATAVIAGLGPKGYVHAVKAMADLINGGR